MPILRQLVSAVHGDLQDLDISSATVIVLYLLPESIVLINDMLINAIRNGCVLICNTVQLTCDIVVLILFFNYCSYFNETSGVRKP